jgi:hypothetical protein
VLGQATSGETGCVPLREEDLIHLGCQVILPCIYHLHIVGSRAGIFSLKRERSIVDQTLIDEFYESLGTNAKEFVCRETQKLNVVTLLKELIRPFGLRLFKTQNC